MIEPFKDYGDFVNHKNERIICFNVSRNIWVVNVRIYMNVPANIGD